MHAQLTYAGAGQENSRHASLLRADNRPGMELGLLRMAGKQVPSAHAVQHLVTH